MKYDIPVAMLIHVYEFAPFALLWFHLIFAINIILHVTHIYPKANH